MAQRKAGRRLFLVDGYSTIFRAFYAIRGLSNSKGLPTNAVYGFLNMMRKLLREEEPELIGIALDVSRQTFRSEEYAEYKANRSPMPDDLRQQMPYVRRAIEALRIPILELEGFEADDVIGTLARKAVAAGDEVVLVSADKDLFQLVGDGVSMLHTGREKLYDAAAVEDDFGVPPGQVVDVLALMGDSVDNVPGVPGIGEKGAKNLIREHGSLDALLEAAPDLKRKSYREGLQEHREQALLSRKLVTIDTDVEVDLDPESLVLEEPDWEALLELYKELEFSSLVDELQREGRGIPERQWEPATDCADAGEWNRLAAGLGRRIVLAPIGRDGDPTGVAVRSADGGEGDPAAAVFADFRRHGVRQAALASLASWLADTERVLVGHDLKEVVRLALRGGFDGAVRARLVDVMLLAYLLPSGARSYGLAEVVFDRLHVKPMQLADVGWDGDEAPMTGHEPLLRLATERVGFAAELAAVLEPELERCLGPADAPAGRPQEVYENIEEPLIEVLVQMEEAGVALDVDFLHRMAEELQQHLEEVEAEIYRIAGEEFNINSPSQLGEILFEKLDYPVLKRTRKTKSYSTSAETLEELAARGYDLPERILAYREASKLKSTYVDALPGLVDASGRLHTRYQQAVAATGRLSSANPNLQNIPVRSSEGQRIRKAFRAAPDSLLLVADYSQIELRVLAHMADEKGLIRAFEEDADIHRSTAASVFGVAPELVSDEQRRAAKMINFGIAYGISAFGLAQRLGIERGEAAKFIDAYFEQFPGVRTYNERTIEYAEEHGWVETLFGRCRFLPDVRSRNRMVRENAKRMAINAPIQGTAADLLKLAMIATRRRLLADEEPAQLLLTVHDELVIECAAERVEPVAAAVREEMEGVADLAVRLKVDLDWGETWYDAKS